MVTTAKDIETLNQLREDARAAEKARKDAERHKANLEEALKGKESATDDYKKRADTLSQELADAKDEQVTAGMELEEAVSKLEQAQAQKEVATDFLDEALEALKALQVRGGTQQEEKPSTPQGQKPVKGKPKTASPEDDPSVREAKNAVETRRNELSNVQLELSRARGAVRMARRKERRVNNLADKLALQLQSIREDIAKIKEEWQKIAEELEAAKKDVEKAQAQAVTTASRAWEAHDDADAIRVVPSAPVGMIAKRWIPGIRDLKMLTIDVVPRKISSIAGQALKKLQEGNEQDLPFVEDTILKEGIRSEILDVTQHLNARAMSEARKRVLAASYATSLRRLFEHYGAPPSYEVRDPLGNEKAYYIGSELERVVKDTQGFADAVILEQERMPKDDVVKRTTGDQPGPLFAFCREVVKLAVEANQLNLTNVMKMALVGRVRAQI